MPNDTPQTLPADFFSKKQGTTPPQTLPSDFFATKVETPDPTKPEPSVGAAQTIKNIIPKEPMLERHRMIPGPGGGFHQDYKMTESEAQQAQKTILGIMGGVLGGEIVGPAAAVTAGGRMLPWLIRALATSSGVGAGTGMGELIGGAKPKEALETSAKTAATGMVVAGGTKGVGAVLGKVFPKVDPLVKINKLLGVEARDVIPGKTPSSLDEFAANPARGAQKYGLDEAKLSKMNALERNFAIMQARDKAGKSLDQVLDQASQAGKKVNVQDVINDTFSEISDPKLSEQAEKRMLQILDKAGITKPLRDLSPMEARTVQRGLDNFAKFANESEAKSFGDIADQLRSGISKETRKVVPESAEFDRDYTDLVRASNATQKTASEFATTFPENKLRKLTIKGILAAGAGAAGAAGYEGFKHWGTPVP